MPAALLSTIDLLESELVKAKAALQEIQPNVAATAMQRDELAVGAMTAYRQQLIGRAPDFYGSRRLSPKEIGLVPVVHEVAVSDTDSDDGDGDVASPAAATVTVMPPRRPSLVSVLSNSLVLDHMAPYLSTPSLLTLASTSRPLRAAVLETPYVFRHLDLTRCRGAQLQGHNVDEDLVTEDEYYAGPVRGILDNLSRRSILQGVRTLVLDGLPVPADLVADIVLTDRFNVNILSLRGCQHLNERKLMQLLQYAVRPTRPAGTPRVKGIYHFTPLPQNGEQRSPNTSSSTEEVEDEQHAWYRPSGQILKNIDTEWAQTIKKCQGIIAFDAVLCRGGHVENQPAIATVALGQGCDSCHSTPEGPSIWGQSPLDHFPLLTPVPLHSSSVMAAKRPVLSSDPTFIARCTDCVTNRRCNQCRKWFCSTCLPQPVRISALSPHQTAIQGPRPVPDVSLFLLYVYVCVCHWTNPPEQELERGVSKDCWECGPTVSLQPERRPTDEANGTVHGLQDQGRADVPELSRRVLHRA